MLTYNHENFIAQAIDGVMMQKTNFNYKLIIGEDCSTDRTREICIEYQNKFPDKIQLLFNEQNIGMMSNFVQTLLACTGKFIALCEGDDYWTDPYKLQKQVDFLEANPDFAICFHNMQIIYENEPEKNRLSNPPEQKEITTIENLANGNYIYTASCVFRKQNYELPEWFYKSPVGDYPLHMLNARFGKIKYLKDVMAVYRVHNGGIWEHNNIDYRLPLTIDVLLLFKDYFDSNINSIIRTNLERKIEQLLSIYSKNQNKLKQIEYIEILLDINPLYFKNITKLYEKTIFLENVIKNLNSRKLIKLENFLINLFKKKLCIL